MYSNLLLSPDQKKRRENHIQDIENSKFFSKKINKDITDIIITKTIKCNRELDESDEEKLEDIFLIKKNCSNLDSDDEELFSCDLKKSPFNKQRKLKQKLTPFLSKKELYQDLVIDKVDVNKNFSNTEEDLNNLLKNNLSFSCNDNRFSFSTDESYTKIESTNEIDCGCKCKNSKCLRLHCSCFKTLGYCGKNCRCRNCLNLPKYNKAREFVINKTKVINKMAFCQKIATIKHINGAKIMMEGCNCTKGCNSNYCGCKKIGGFCSPICRCVECQNSKISLTREEIQQVYKPYSRKKHKLVINFNDTVNQTPQDQNIVFELYKK
jgi:hypothetical protein